MHYLLSVWFCIILFATYRNYRTSSLFDFIYFREVKCNDMKVDAHTISSHHQKSSFSLSWFPRYLQRFSAFLYFTIARFSFISGPCCRIIIWLLILSLASRHFYSSCLAIMAFLPSCHCYDVLMRANATIWWFHNYCSWHSDFCRLFLSRFMIMNQYSFCTGWWGRLILYARICHISISLIASIKLSIIDFFINFFLPLNLADFENDLKHKYSFMSTL